jgi:hypothetical protein
MPLSFHNDSAVEAGLLRSGKTVSRFEVMTAISRKIMLNPSDRLLISTGLLPGDGRRGEVQLMMENLADDGVLERRFTVGCPECGEFDSKMFKSPVPLDELPLGKKFRCGECKHSYEAQHHDFFCRYYVPETFEPLPVDDPRVGRDNKADDKAVEKAAKKLIRAKRTPFYASEIEQETGIPGEIVRANLALMVRFGDLSEHNVLCCRGCGNELSRDPHEIQISRITCLEKCPACDHPPFVVTPADVLISYDEPSGGVHHREGMVGAATF